MRAEAGARSGAPVFLVLLTDGKSQDDAIAAANRLKSAGVEIIAVGEAEEMQTTTFKSPAFLCSVGLNNLLFHDVRQFVLIS